MAPNPQVLNNAQILFYGGTISGTADLSGWANKVSLTDEADQVEVTGFSPNSYRSYTQGLKKSAIAVTFFQDFQAGTAPDAILGPLYYAAGTFTVEVRPTAAARSATNPGYAIAAKMYGWSPLDGGVGDAATIDVEFQNAGTAGLVRVTSGAGPAPV